MCLIVDMCVAHRAIDPTDDDFEPVRAALTSGRQVLVLGGQLRREYMKYLPLLRFVAELDRRGGVRILLESAIDDETARVRKLGLCESNDEHLIALARVSGARLLCTTDGPATRDFKKKALIDSPRGKVYKRRSHRHLLGESCEACG